MGQLTTWLSLHPYLAGAIGTIVGVLVATVVSLFEDPDDDPTTPPPKWVVPFIVVQRVFTIVAPRGTLGLFGGRLSIPVLHYPKVTRRGSTPPPTPPSAIVLVALFLSLTIPGCATWDEMARISIITIERTHVEASIATREYNARRIEDFKQRAARVKTTAELDALEAEHAIYEAKMRKVVDGFNKAWATIAQLRTTYPLLKRVTDPKERRKVDGFIVDALAFLLQGKDTLSAFGVQIGGGAL